MKEEKQGQIILLFIACLITCYFAGWLLLSITNADHHENRKTKIINRFLCGLIALVLMALSRAR